MSFVKTFVLKVSERTGEGKFPRWMIHRVMTKDLEVWKYDCNGLSRDHSIKWHHTVLGRRIFKGQLFSVWPQKKASVLVGQTLSPKASSHRVKYQYITTVYSKDQGIWPSVEN